MNYAEQPETSAAQKLDHCNGCGLCCRVAPCLLLPGDIRRVCDGAGMSRKELSQHLQVELTKFGKWQVRMKPECVFLEGNSCKAHEFKPTGGRDFKCWTDNKQAYFWNKSDLRLVGFRP